MKKYLVIQTASIGDVILSTSIAEKLKSHDEFCQVDYLIKKGIEGVFHGNMKVNQLFVWDKKQKKYQNLFAIISQVREEKYDAIINLQRFFSTGLISVLSGAKKKYGYQKNPLSLFFSKRFPHVFKDGWHEIDRNHQLIKEFTDSTPARPRLYPTQKDFAKMSPYKTNSYITITPASLWFTKQYPVEKWKEFIKQVETNIYIYFLGGPDDFGLCQNIMDESGRKNMLNFSGKLSFVESAALMRDARMNYVNDSAALHIASSVNAPISSIFCSTIPTFGFGPLSDDSLIIETKEKLSCKPCGLHGQKTCPEGHFKCATTIRTQELLNRL